MSIELAATLPQVETELVVHSLALLAACGEADVPAGVVGDDLVSEIVPRLLRIQHAADQRSQDTTLSHAQWQLEQALASAAHELLRRWKRAYAYPAWLARKPFSMGQLCAIFGISPRAIQRWVDTGRVELVETPEGVRFDAACVRISCEQDAEIDRVQVRLAEHMHGVRIDFDELMHSIERGRRA